MESMREDQNHELSTNPEMILLNERNLNPNINVGNNEENEKPKYKNSILWEKLRKLVIRILIYGSVLGLINTLILSFRFILKVFIIRGKKFSTYYIQYFVRFVILGISIIVFALPLGLTVALIIGIIYSVIKMKSENISVKKFNTFESIGYITSICFNGQAIQDQQKFSQQIKQCKRAGITVRFMTSDSVESTHSLAEKLFILENTQNLQVFDSRVFNQSIRSPSGEVNQELFDKIWPDLRVLALSSANDKYVLVKHIIQSKLNSNKEVVAFIGSEESDRLALRISDVGLVFTTTGTDEAKEASDIILTDDKLSNIVRAVVWGRNVNEILAKFLQFQLTINLVTVVVESITNFVMESSTLWFTQVLWIEIFIGSFVTLSLAIETPDNSLMFRKSNGRTESILTRQVIINIIGQSIYQLIIIYVLLFYGDKFFELDSGLYVMPETEPSQHFTLIFNTFAIMSLFNAINSQIKIGEEHRFCGLSSNPIAYGILIIALIIHIVIAQFVGPLLTTSQMSLQQWFWCLAFGLSTLLCGLIMRIIIHRICSDKKVDVNPADL